MMSRNEFDYAMAMNLWEILHDLDLFSNTSRQEFQSKFESGNIFKTISFLRDIRPEIFNDFSFLVLFNNGKEVSKWEIGTFDKKKRIIIVFDEFGRIPTELVKDSRNIVFHAYLSFADSEKKFPNLFHYPLGCNSFVPETNYVSSSNRKMNVFYSGNLHNGRKKLYQSLTHLHFVPFPLLTRLQEFLKIEFDRKFPSSYVRFTNKFSGGLTLNEYASWLSNSKIILSPPGISNLECFRHYEGLRAGCVVIAEQLPDKPQLKDSPIIEVKNWSSGFETIRDLLNNPERLEELSGQSYNWYREHLSPRSVAQYIVDKIETVKAISEIE